MTEPLNPYEAETEKMTERFKTLFVEISVAASDDTKREQKSHTLTGFVRALVHVGLEHLGNRPEAIAWIVNEELVKAMRERARAVDHGRTKTGLN